MTSSARDTRYGRRGGRWAETRTGATCRTCANGDARYLATHRYHGDSWPVCGTCRAQGERLDAPITYGPLP